MRAGPFNSCLFFEIPAFDEVWPYYLEVLSELIGVAPAELRATRRMLSAEQPQPDLRTGGRHPLGAPVFGVRTSHSMTTYPGRISWDGSLRYTSDSDDSDFAAGSPDEPFHVV